EAGRRRRRGVGPGAGAGPGGGRRGGRPPYSARGAGAAVADTRLARRAGEGALPRSRVGLTITWDDSPDDPRRTTIPDPRAGGQGLAAVLGRPPGRGAGLRRPRRARVRVRARLPPPGREHGRGPTAAGGRRRGRRPVHPPGRRRPPRVAAGRGGRAVPR